MIDAIGTMLLSAMAASAGGASSGDAATHASITAATFTVRDYPAAARKNGEKGRSAFRILVDANGRVRECITVETSGSALLDQQSCRMASRARFKPARDAQGRNVPEYLRWAFVWQDPQRRDFYIEDLVPEIDPSSK